MAVQPTALLAIRMIKRWETEGETGAHKVNLQIDKTTTITRKTINTFYKEEDTFISRRGLYEDTVIKQINTEMKWEKRLLLVVIVLVAMGLILNMWANVRHGHSVFYHFTDPSTLPGYCIGGVICGVVALFLATSLIRKHYHLKKEFNAEKLETEILAPIKAQAVRAERIAIATVAEYSQKRVDARKTIANIVLQKEIDQAKR